jgi:hypothetical protein
MKVSDIVVIVSEQDVPQRFSAPRRDGDGGSAEEVQR